jgi:hypothetical protein
VNGALGDVAPRQDAWQGRLTDPRLLAAAFAERVATDLAAGPALESLEVRAARVTRDLGSPHVFAATGSRTRFDDRVAESAVGDDLGSVAANLIALPVNVLPWCVGLSEARVGFSFEGTAGIAVNLDSSVGRPRRAFGAVVLRTRGAAGESGEERALLWLPGEATSALGTRWRDRAGSSGGIPFLFGLTNGSMAYLADEDEYERGGYAAVLTLYGRHAAARVEEALFAALDAARR